MTRSFWWLIWAAGVAAIPLTSFFVPRDGTPYPVVYALPERTGLVVWAGWGAGFALMFAGMLGLRGIRVRTAVIAQVCASVTIATLTIAAPSSDPYTYVVYGEIAQHGDNPWLWNRVAVDDDVTRVATTAWGNPVGPVPYGSAFLLGERALLHLVPHTSTRTLLLVERYVAALAAIGVTLLIRGPRIAFWALHPLVLFEFALGAHNDALMLLLVAASMRMHKPFLAGFAIGLAAMVKVVALGNLLLQRRAAIAVTAAGAALGVVTLLALEPQAATLGPQLHLVPQGPAPTFAVEKILEARRIAHPELAARIIVVFAAIALVLATRARWSRRDAPVYGVALVIAAAPLFYPWYATWALMPALFASRPLRGIVLALTAAVYLLDLSLFSAREGNHFHGITAVFWSVVAVSVASSVIAARRRRIRRVALATVCRT